MPPAPAAISADSALATAATYVHSVKYPGQRRMIERMAAMFIDPNPKAAARDAGRAPVKVAAACRPG